MQSVANVERKAIMEESVRMERDLRVLLGMHI